MSNKMGNPIAGLLEPEKEILDEVLREFYIAEAKHPKWPVNIFEQFAIVGEELGEAQQAALQAKYDDKDWGRIRKEMVQVAAMSLRLLFNWDCAERGNIKQVGVEESEAEDESM